MYKNQSIYHIFLLLVGLHALFRVMSRSGKVLSPCDIFLLIPGKKLLCSNMGGNAFNLAPQILVRNSWCFWQQHRAALTLLRSATAIKKVKFGRHLNNKTEMPVWLSTLNFSSNFAILNSSQLTMTSQDSTTRLGFHNIFKENTHTCTHTHTFYLPQEYEIYI